MRLQEECFVRSVVLDSVKGWYTGRVWLMTLSASLRIVVMCSSYFPIYIKTNYLDLEKILSSG